MNTKGIKFLAVLAVLAMAFAALAVVANVEENDAAVPAGANDDNYKIVPTVTGGDAPFDMYVNKSAKVTATVDVTNKKITLAGTMPYVNGSEIIGTTGTTTIGGLFGTGVNANAGYIVFYKDTAAVGDKFTQTGNNTLKTLFPATEGNKTSTLDADKAVVVLVNNGNGFKVDFADNTTNGYTIDVTGLSVGGNVTVGQKTETYTVSFPGNAYSIASGSVSGTGVNNATANALSGMVGVPEAQPYSFALIGIDGLTSKVKDSSNNSANTLKITSENSTWKYFSTAYGGIDNDKMTRERAFAIADDVIAGTDNFVSVMIPQDKSTVKITFTYYKTATPGTIKSTDVAIATTTVTLNCAEAYTDVTLGAASVKGIGYDYAYSNATTATLTLTDYDGNATFKGVISQVTLSGDNVITAKAIDHAIYNTAATGLTVKPVQGDGSLSIILDDAVNDINAIYSNSGGAQDIEIKGSEIAIVVNSINEAGRTINGLAGAKVSLYESEVAIDLDAQKNTTAIKATSLDVSSCMDGVMLSAKYGVTATGNVNMQMSDVLIGSSIWGISATKLTASKTGLVVSAAIALPDSQVAPCGMRLSTISAENNSDIIVDNVRLTGAGSTNNATITVLGDLVIDTAATFTNFATMEVQGKTLVIGKLYNQGTFTATGDVTISKFANAAKSDNLIIPQTGAGVAAAFAPLASISDTSYYVKTITIVAVNDIELNADGNATVWAKFTFALKTNAETTVVKDSSYMGTATLDADGGVTAMNFIIKTTDGTTEYLLPVNVAWTSYTDAGATKYQYAVDANGKFYKDAAITVEPSEYKDASLSAADKTTKILAAATTAGFDASAGEFTAAAGFAVNYAQAQLVSGTGVLNANVTVNDNITLAAGILNGDLTVLTEGKTIAINKDATVNGKIAADKAVTLNVVGTLKGDIAVKDNVTALNIQGKYDGTFSISGKYKGTSTSTAADTDYSAAIEMSIVGKNDTNIIQLVTVAATTAAPGAAGYINLTAVGDLAKFKSDSSIRSTDGVFQLGGNLTIPTKLAVTAASTGTISIAPSYTVTINGAIIVDEGGVFNYYDADAKIYSYGKANNEIKFTVEGKTYYCSFEYALGNAPAGTPLTVTTDVNVADNIAVKDGVVITVSAGKTVTISKSITMGEGASFDLMDGAKVLFKTTAADKVDSGVFTYGDNEVILTGVFFTADDSTITAVKATGIVLVDRLVVDVKGFNAGTIEIVSGAIDGNIKYITKEVGTTTSSGSVTIDEDALYAGTFEYVPKAKIVNNGIYAPSVDVEMSVAWSGTGYVLLSEGKRATITAVADGTAAAAIKQNMIITDGFTDIVLKDACFESAAVFTAVKATTTVPANITISDFTLVVAGGEPAAGTKYVYGDITIDGYVTVGDLAMYEKATITAEKDSVLTIAANKKVYALGLLKSAGTINKKVGDDATYGELKNQVEYKEGDYTVYAYLGSAITEGGVSDMVISNNITLAGGATPETAKNLGNVSLEVTEGKKLTLTGYVSIGTASTSLAGVIFGISGNVILANNTDVLIVYDSATVDADKIWTDADMTVKAKKSAFIVDKDSSTYAVAYNNGGATLANVEACMNPTFDGYRFTGYTPYVVGAANVGDSDVAINLTAGKVSVVLTKVEGATYYVNNVAYKQMGVPVELKVGDVVSAAANSGYKGDVKVNGEDFITIDTMTKTITATGMTPVEPEPTPAEKEAFGITEILLVVLVILIAVMVIVVLLRMNRS